MIRPYLLTGLGLLAASHLHLVQALDFNAPYTSLEPRYFNDFNETHTIECRTNGPNPMGPNYIAPNLCPKLLSDLASIAAPAWFHWDKNVPFPRPAWKQGPVETWDTPKIYHQSGDCDLRMNAVNAETPVIVTADAVMKFVRAGAAKCTDDQNPAAEWVLFADATLVMFPTKKDYLDT